MRNKMKAILLTLAIASAGTQSVTVLAAPEAVFVSETDKEENAESTENTEQFTDHAAIEELRQKKDQAAEEKAREKRLRRQRSWKIKGKSL